MKPRGRRIVLSTGAVAVVFLALATYLAWPHLVFWYLFAPLGLNAQGYSEYRHRQTGIVFVRLPGGKFWMGAQRTDPKGQNYDADAKDDEGPVHEVTPGPFMIAKYEVTQAQWKLVMGTKPSGIWGYDDLPVEQISWNDIQNFEAKTGLSLPTEAQWEYAGRGASHSPFAGTGSLEDMGWYDGNATNTSHPCGQKAPNGFGLHDTHGNVWEWCEDIYDAKCYRKSEADRPNSMSNLSSGDRVIRGGGWRFTAPTSRSAFRNSYVPEIRSFHVGFRPAYPLP